MKTFGILLLMMGGTSVAFAGGSVVPEIDANTAVSAIALTAGVVTILRARLKK